MANIDINRLCNNLITDIDLCQRKLIMYLI